MAGKVSDVLKTLGIHLAQDQRRAIVELDNEFAQQNTEIDELKTRIQRLEARVHPLERENERLQERLEEAAKKTAPLDAEESQVIKIGVGLPRFSVSVIAIKLDI